MRPTDPIIADLRPAFRGGLDADPVTRGLYSTDASVFAVTPSLVATPLDTDDVVTLVRYAAEHNLPIQARGAGTGLAGESLGPGIVLDFSVHFRGLPIFDGELVRVRPGITLNELNLALAKHGRRLTPDPANGAACTIGGMIATDASGSNAAVFGTMRDHVERLSVVWDTGETDDLSQADSPRTHAIATALADLVRNRKDLIHDQKRNIKFDRCGYRLHDLATPTGIDLRRILVGSEGTLGIVTDAVLRTVPIPEFQIAAAVGFPSIEAAAKSGVIVGALPGVVRCDLLDRRLVTLGSGLTVPNDTEAMLIVEWETDKHHQFEFSTLPSADARWIVEPTQDPAAVHAIRKFRHSALAGIYALRAGPRPTPIVEDLGVPPERVPECLSQLQAILRTRDITAAVLVHSAMGAIHLLPFVDFNRPADRERLWSLADELANVVIGYGGTISVQHGLGIARTPWVRTQVGELADVYREVKRIFDPRSILNPGKIVGPDPTRPAWPLRPIVPAPTATPLLVWADSPQTEASQCNRCGDCRPRSGADRMCPVFRAKSDEGSTPRAKANLIRLLDDPELASDRASIREVAKLCTNCQMCRSECHSHVDIPKLMVETKAMLWRDHGTSRLGWFLARMEMFLGLASRFTLTANTLLGTRPGRWLLEKIFGLDRTLRLPALRYRTFLWRAWTKGWTKRPKQPGAKKFVVWVDPMTNVADPLTGEAAVVVLKHHGADVVVLGSKAIGLAALTAGDLETARDTAKRNLRVLGEYLRDGYTVVCLDPATLLTFKREYPNLLTDADTKLLAAQTVDILALLNQWHDAGELKTDFREQDLTIGHHSPCHAKAMHGTSPGPALLNLVPGYRVTAIDDGCSGMMGPWGLLAKHRADSRVIGERMLDRLADRALTYGSSECGSCRIQMQDATGKRAIHPIQYLAMAYGLLPEIGRRLATPLSPRLSR